MYRKPAHAVVMSTVLILVLAVVGVAYTQFAGSNLILGSVGTANMSLDWEVTSGSVCAVATDAAGNPDPSTVEVTITGAVPGDFYECGLRLRNTGTVRVEITGELVEAETDAAGVPLWTLADGSDHISDPSVGPNTNGGPVFVKYINGSGHAIDPSDIADSTIWVSVEDFASPSTTYNFTVTVSYVHAP